MTVKTTIAAAVLVVLSTTAAAQEVAPMDQETFCRQMGDTIRANEEVYVAAARLLFEYQNTFAAFTRAAEAEDHLTIDLWSAMPTLASNLATKWGDQMDGFTARQDATEALFRAYCGAIIGPDWSPFDGISPY